MHSHNILKVTMQNRNFKKREEKPFVVSNERIRHKEIRVSAEHMESQVMLTADALKEARSLGLDLILVADKASPPVCKINDLNKHPGFVLIYAIPIVNLIFLFYLLSTPGKEYKKNNEKNI